MHAAGDGNDIEHQEDETGTKWALLSPWLL